MYTVYIYNIYAFYMIPIPFKSTARRRKKYKPSSPTTTKNVDGIKQSGREQQGEKEWAKIKSNKFYLNDRENVNHSCVANIYLVFFGELVYSLGEHWAQHNTHKMCVCFWLYAANTPEQPST